MSTDPHGDGWQFAAGAFNFVEQTGALGSLVHHVINHVESELADRAARRNVEPAAQPAGDSRLLVYSDALTALRAICEFWDEASADDERSVELHPDALIGGHAGDEPITIHDVLRAIVARADAQKGGK